MRPTDATGTVPDPRRGRAPALPVMRRMRMGQVLRFGLVGVLGTVVNVAILHVLHTELGWGFTRSSAIATELAIVHNYIWNELWTFHIRQLDFGRLVRYQMSSLLAAVVTVVVATIAKEVIDPRLAQFVGIVAGAGLNYVVNVRWTWGPAATIARTRNEDALMLADQIQTDLHSAMKARDRHAVAALRMVLARIKEARTTAGHGAEVTDDEVHALIRREAKRREEAAATFVDAGRTELAETEEAELEVLQRYLPAEMSDDDLSAIVDETIAETGASSPQDVGRVMGAVMPRLEGRASGSRVNALVRQRLSSGV